MAELAIKIRVASGSCHITTTQGSYNTANNIALSAWSQRKQWVAFKDWLQAYYPNLRVSKDSKNDERNIYLEYSMVRCLL